MNVFSRERRENLPINNGHCPGSLRLERILWRKRVFLSAIAQSLTELFRWNFVSKLFIAWTMTYLNFIKIVRAVLSVYIGIAGRIKNWFHIVMWNLPDASLILRVVFLLTEIVISSLLNFCVCYFDIFPIARYSWCFSCFEWMAYRRGLGCVVTLSWGPAGRCHGVSKYLC